MFDALKKLFRFKRSEVEAKLSPTPECTWGGVGEVEVEHWSDGGVSIEASIKHSGVPDGTELEVWCAGNRITSLLVARGYAKAYVNSGAATQSPVVGIGDEAEFRHAGSTLYRGTFRRD